MAAAFFESEGDDTAKTAQRAALNWLTSLGPPSLRFAEAIQRSAVTCYVPVNDSSRPNKAMLQSAPGMPRSRQPRTFPTVVPDCGAEGTADVELIWDCGEVPQHHFAAIEQICRDVIRVGHSSSLVMMWAEDRIKDDCIQQAWQPVDRNGTLSLRLASVGELDRLEQACNADRIEQFAELAERIESSSGKQKSAAKAEFEAAFAEPYKRSLRPPEPLSPVIGTWQGYQQQGQPSSQPAQGTYFDRELLIFQIHEGPALGIERGLGLTQALRNKAMKECPVQPPPEWLSGHNEDGSPSQSPHAAWLALPFAGTKWADGHIMGAAVAIPQRVPSEERARCLGPLLVDQETGDLLEVGFRLWAAQLPDLTMRLCQEVSPPISLSNETWTKPSRTWSTVTPVVLDRFPKPSKIENREKWLDEVRRILAQSCERSGLPIPARIDVSTTSFTAGIPRAVVKNRRVGRDRQASSSLGDGFPAFSSAKQNGRPPRPQVHVRLEYDQPVIGPVLIGAGRFAGFGLCLPAGDD
jgi:CRISPR-associated protein Csb2